MCMWRRSRFDASGTKLDDITWCEFSLTYFTAGNQGARRNYGTKQMGRWFKATWVQTTALACPGLLRATR